MLTCKKNEGAEALFSANSPSWAADADYALVALKAGSAKKLGPRVHTLFEGVKQGDTLTTNSLKGISHMILCPCDCQHDDNDEPGAFDAAIGSVPASSDGASSKVNASQTVSDTVKLVTVATMVVSAAAGSRSGAATSLLAALSHSAITAKLDVFQMRTPAYVTVSGGFDIFNLQSLPTPGLTHDTSAVAADSGRRALQAVDDGNDSWIVPSPTPSPSPSLGTRGDGANSSSDCYSASTSWSQARSALEAITQMTSNMFWVTLFFVAAGLLQLLAFCVVRAAMPSGRVAPTVIAPAADREEEEEKEGKEASENQRKHGNNFRMRKPGETSPDTLTLRRDSSSNSNNYEESKAGKGVSRRACDCQMVSMHIAETVLALMLMRTKDDAAPARAESPPLADGSSSSANRHRNRPSPTCRDVLGKFVLRSEQVASSSSSSSQPVVRVTTQVYFVLLLAVYQGVCESTAAVIASLGQLQQQQPGAVDNGTLSSEGLAVGAIAFIVVVVIGMVLVWSILLACVRPRIMAHYVDERSEWVGTDAHGSLLQHAGSIFGAFRDGAGRYLFAGVWMINLALLAFILAFSTGREQLCVSWCSSRVCVCVHVGGGGAVVVVMC